MTGGGPGNHPVAVRPALACLLCLPLGCANEELAARVRVDPPVDASADAYADAYADGPAPTPDAGHADVVLFDAPFEARPPADDAGDDALEEACGAYCACMRRTCTKVSGYPYDVDAGADCLGVCRAFSARERTCWSQSCRTAELYDVASVRDHLCQHAFGTFGLNECP